MAQELQQLAMLKDLLCYVRDGGHFGMLYQGMQFIVI